jgi:hypothetical protein
MGWLFSAQPDTFEALKGSMQTDKRLYDVLTRSAEKRKKNIVYYAFV